MGTISIAFDFMRTAKSKKPQPRLPRKQSLHWMESRLRRLKHIKQPDFRQVQRMTHLERAIEKLEAKAHP